MIYKVCDLILGGMNEDLNYWSWHWMTGYLLMISLAFVCSGGITSYLAQKSYVYYLPRQGYQRWVHRILLPSVLSVIPVVVMVCLLALKSGSSQEQIILAAVVMILNLMFLTEVQTLLILLRNASLGYVCIWVQQFAAMIFSQYLPGNWKLLLPGNWGMLGRSSVLMEDGFSLAAALVIEVAAGILVWVFGWRLVRQVKRSVS